MINVREVRNKIDIILTSDDVVSNLESARLDGTFDFLPEIAAIVALGDGDHMHKNVWEHTKHVVSGAPNKLELRWAALLHDIGKAPTRRFLKNGKVTFANHDVVGARMFDRISQRTKLFVEDETLASTVRTLVLQHLRPPSYGPTWTDSAVRRLVTDCGGIELFSSLMDLSRADLTTRIKVKRDRALRRASALEERVMKIVAEDAAPKLPKGTMGIILDRSKKSPGRWLREIQVDLERRLRAGEISAGLSAEEIADFACK